MTVAENLRMAELRGKRRGLRLGLDRTSLERYGGRSPRAVRGTPLYGEMRVTKDLSATIAE
jgi:ABC-type uncharacterized transport system ATPase component